MIKVGTMDGDRQINVHITIQKGCIVPPLQKCSCCTPSRYHCPFCSPALFKPSKYGRTLLHLDSHIKRAIYVGEHTVHRCGLQCRKHPHYHCLYCAATLIRRIDFIKHLQQCCQSQQWVAQNIAQLRAEVSERFQTAPIAPSPTPGESDIHTHDIESDSDREDINIVSDSDDENSHGASSGHSVQSPQQSNPKCHRTVQTDFDKPQDCDEYYFMSLVKVFKKLNPQKKADVRMKIERLLFEAEFQ